MYEPRIAWPSNTALPDLRAVEQFGRKAVGLMRLPTVWRPPFFVLESSFFVAWREANTTQRAALLVGASAAIVKEVQKFSPEWDAGIILRSSAVSETLNDRGAYQSRPLTADHSQETVVAALEEIFEHFEASGAKGSIAVIVQPIVRGLGRFYGHLSNERRVSKTVNHWMYEILGAGSNNRFNAQRASPPDPERPLTSERPRDLLPLFRSIGRWVTQLALGPAHLEWALSNGRLWLLQLDFEDESPDGGVNPRSLIRTTDSSKIRPRNFAPLREFDATRSATIGRNKLDNVRTLAAVRDASYPRLYYLIGDQLPDPSRQFDQLVASIQQVSNGRVVCRTDCRTAGIRSVNLPRTHSVTPLSAAIFMKDTLSKLQARGASAHDVCFILHRFIPAMASAWALADPKSPIVRIDSLWGIPDGLQFLPHDTYEFDIRRKKLASETLRYKMAFIQETESGDWRELPIQRRLGRASSLSGADVQEIANQTHEVAKALDERVQVMWFCDIPEALRIGRNLPWFRMKAPNAETRRPRPVAPSRPRFIIRTTDNLAEAASLPPNRYVLTIDPDVELIRRDDSFLDELIGAARKINAPIELHGSILGHAYYVLSKAGLTVIATGELAYSRARGKQVFAKLVRDRIPAQIEQRGETTLLARIPKQDARAALVVKLFEEAYELLSAGSPDEVEAELGDLVEVIRALSAATGVSWQDVLEKADQKRAKRGGFEGGTILMETSWTTGVPPASTGRTAPLKTLSSKSYDGSVATINYATFLATGADRTLKLDNGVTYRLTLTGSGLNIQRVEPSEDRDQQLPLPGFERDDKNQ